MANKREKLAAILNGKARELCNPNSAAMKMKTQNQNINNDYYSDSDDWDKMYLSEASYNQPSSKEQKNIDIQYGTDNINESNLPPHIKESFAKQKIDMNSTGGFSVLDSLGVKPQERIIQEQPLPQQKTYNTNAMIDYSIVKAIINECLKDFFNKQPLNESAPLQTISLQNGNISLVDNKGNIYKAKLEKIGNKNDKK